VQYKRRKGDKMIKKYPATINQERKDFCDKQKQERRKK
jgi:hypothetical protein